MKIACLHFDLSGGPEERNISKLCAGIVQAAEQGASWIITPEMAVQGYFFTQMGRPYTIYSQPSDATRVFQALAKKYGVTIFLGSAERDEDDGHDYNACLVIEPSGKIVGRHRKLRTVHSVTEGWSTPGSVLTPIFCNDVKTGVLVCADAWFGEHSRQLGDMGAEIIVVIAAWPPGCGGPPEDAWKRASILSGGLPVVVCNQTGNTRGLNCTIAQSAVIVDGVLRTAYSGENEAILLTELNVKHARYEAPNFEIMDFQDKQRR